MRPPKWNVSLFRTQQLAYHAAQPNSFPLGDLHEESCIELLW